MEDREGTDMITGFPDDILRRISSFLPLKEMVRTSVLSARWRSLWTPARLKMNLGAGAINNMVEESVQVLIDTFLASYEVPEARRLCFTGRPGADHEPLTIVATKGAEKELHLQFSDDRKDKRSYCLKFKPALDKSNLADLRHLHLWSVTALSSGFVSALTSSCHLLKSLNLEKCRGLETVVIDKNSSLEELAISDCPDLDSISICATELKSFRYRGALPMIELKTTPSLAEVALDLRDVPGAAEFDCEEVLSLLDSMKEVQALTVSGWLLEWLCSAGVIYGKLEFQFSRLKELCWTGSSISSSKRDSLACFLNICPALSKLSVAVDHGLGGPVHCPVVHQHWHEPHLWRDYDAMKADVSPLEQLKEARIVFGHLADEEMQLSLMELLLEKAVALESMSVITSP